MNTAFDIPALPPQIVSALSRFEFKRFKREYAPSCFYSCYSEFKAECSVYKFIERLYEHYPSLDGLSEIQFTRFLSENPDMQEGFLELSRKLQQFID